MNSKHKTLRWIQLKRVTYSNFTCEKSKMPFDYCNLVDIFYTTLEDMDVEEVSGCTRHTYEAWDTNQSNPIYIGNVQH